MSLHEKLAAAVDGCAVPGWDGERAKPVSAATRKHAERLCVALSEFPDADIACAADGSICFEWDSGKDRVWMDVESGNRIRALYRLPSRRAEVTFSGKPDEAIASLKAALGEWESARPKWTQADLDAAKERARSYRNVFNWS